MIIERRCAIALSSILSTVAVFSFIGLVDDRTHTTDNTTRLNYKFAPVSPMVCNYPGQGQFCDRPIDVALICRLESDDLCIHLKKVAETDQRLRILSEEDSEQAKVLLWVSYMYDDDRKDPGLLTIGAETLSDIKADTPDRFGVIQKNISYEMSIMIQS